MNKLRPQLILAFDLFFLLVVGGVMLFYMFFAEDYYLKNKMENINLTFEQVQQYDLDELSLEDDDVFLPFEEESFSMLICNDQFESIYSKNYKVTDALIQENILEKLDLYSADAVATYHESEHGKPLYLHGLISQGNQNFYVYIYESTRVLRRSIRYVNHFLREILVVVLVLGSLFAFCLATWIVKPVARIQKAANRLAKNDFSVRLPDKQPRNELGQLSVDINQMADKIQRDINDLSNYNYLLLRQNRNMAEFEDMRKKLVSSFTHELKTPLAIISSQLELLQYEYNTDKKDYYFSSIMEEIDKMSKLISTILQNSKMENQLQHTELLWSNLSEIVTELLPKYENWLSARKIRFTSSVEEDCSAYLDRLQMEQAINNYMMNAVRHTKPGRNVHLTLRSEEDTLYLSIYNDGPRLPAQELDRVWTSFYQSGKTTSDGGTEIGLGLYIVKDILSHHHGSCGVMNREQGVEFWMRLPKNEI